MADFELLKKFCDTPGVSSDEWRIAEIMTEHLAKTAKTVEIDNLGSVIAHFPGTGPKVLLAAHMDEVGFMVSSISEQGFIKVIPIGGIDPRSFYAQRVIVHGKEDVRGIVGAVPPHLIKDPDARKNAPAIEDLFIDLGMDGGMVRDMVSVGDMVTFDTVSWDTETHIFAKALDDRVGCFIMLEVADKMKKLGCDLYIAGTVQEERGMKGAGAVASRVQPDIAIAVEGTFATDMAANPGVATEQGKGPEMRICDRAMISDRELVAAIDKIAKDNDLPIQLAVKSAGATDSAQIQVVGLGAKVTGLAIPLRYIHDPCGIGRKSDIVATIALLTKFVEETPAL